MKYDAKICLPAYKICYACLYLILLSLVTGVAYQEEIGAVLDTNVSLLVMVLCAETYCMEWSGRRGEIFVLYESRRKSLMVCKRLLIQTVFLWLLACGGYFCFFWQRPIDRGVVPFFGLYGSYVIAVTVTILFWSLLSMTISNLAGNQWVGIGACIMLWLAMTSKAGQEFLGDFSIFAYGSQSLNEFGREWRWLAGKAVGLLAAVIMIALIPLILKKKDNLGKVREN